MAQNLTWDRVSIAVSHKQLLEAMIQEIVKADKIEARSNDVETLSKPWTIASLRRREIWR